jgi:hypothetical protein
MTNLAQGQPAPQTREEFLQHGRRRRADEAALVVKELEAAFKRLGVACSDADLGAAATVYAVILAGDAGS